MNCAVGIPRTGAVAGAGDAVMLVLVEVVKAIARGSEGQCVLRIAAMMRPKGISPQVDEDVKTTAVST